MHLFRKTLLPVLSMLVLSVASAIPGVAAKAGDRKAFDSININNFGQMDDRFYRGAQPKAEDFKALSALGIKTVIDLRDDPASYERSAAETNGMRYVNIPMSDKGYPTESEMKAYDFYTRFGHSSMKKYVEDYWQRIQANGYPAVLVDLPGQTKVAAR